MTEVLIPVSPDESPLPRPLKGPGKGGRVNPTLFSWLMIAPALVILIAFTHYPVIMSVIRSMQQKNGSVSFGNYERMLNDSIFWQVLTNNLWFALGTVPTSIALAILMAVWVNGKLRGRGFVRLAYFMPTMLPMVAVASIWLFFYSPGIGPIDTVLKFFGVPGLNWLGDPSLVLAAMMIMVIWKLAGFFMIFYLAGLQNLSPELEEASAIEGASKWYHFRRVTFPLLMPTTLFVFVVAVTDAFKVVDQIYVMTDGGPNNASNLLLYYIYENAFRFFDLPYAGTLTVALVVILGGIALLQFKVIEKRVHYQ